MPIATSRDTLESVYQQVLSAFDQGTEYLVIYYTDTTPSQVWLQPNRYEKDPPPGVVELWAGKRTFGFHKLFADAIERHVKK